MPLYEQPIVVSGLYHGPIIRAGSLFSPAAQAVPQFPSTAAALASITPNLGLATTIRPITEVTGTLEATAGTQNLTPGGNPVYTTASNSSVFPNKRVVITAVASTDNFSVADPYFTVGTGSFGKLQVVRFADATADQYIFRKTTGGTGYGLIIRAGESFRVALRDGVNPAQLVNPTGVITINKDYVIVYGVDRSTGNVVTIVHDGTSAIINDATPLTTTGSLSSGDLYYLGSNTGTAGMEIIYDVDYLGNAFDGAAVADAAAFAAHIGL